MTDNRIKFKLDPRCYSILESVRDERLLPSLNVAINFLIGDYRRLQDENRRLQNQLILQHRGPNGGQEGAKQGPKVDSAKA